MSPRAAAALPLALAAALSAIGWLALGTVESTPQFEVLQSQPPFLWDYYGIFLPNAEYAFARLRRGDLPLWNPHQGVGAPIIGESLAGVLYPPSVLHAFVDAQHAFVALAAFHLAVAAALTAGLVRSLGGGRIGAVMGGVAYASSANVLFGLWSPPVLFATAWFPGWLWAVHRLVQAPSVRGASALAGLVALQALAGWPYVLVLSALSAGCFAAALLLRGSLRGGRPPLRAGAALAAGVVAGLLLASPFLLPGRELSLRSTRPPGSVTLEQALFVEAFYEPRELLGGLANVWLTDGVPSLPVLLLGLAAPFLCRGRRLEVGVLLGLAGFALLVSLGSNTPLFGWVRQLPVLSDFRFPFRYRLISTLAFAVAAGLAVQALWDLAVPRGRRWMTAAGAVAALLVLVHGVGLSRPAFPFPRSSSFASPSAREPALAAVLSLVAEDPGTPPGRVLWDARADKVAQLEGIFTVNDAEPLSLADVGRFLNFFQSGVALISEPQEKGGSFAPGAPYFGRIFLPEDGRRARLLDLLSVRWVVSDEDPPDWLHSRYGRLDAPRGVSIYDNAGALPRVYRVAQAERAPAKAHPTLERLLAEDFDPRRSVLLGEVPAGLQGDAGSEADAAPGDVSVERYEPEQILIRTSGRDAGVVVVTDAFYPGWEAWLDGEPAAILRANALFRAVAVPPGEHRIEMRYRPRSLRRGLLLAGAAATGLAAAWLLDARSRSRAA
jgi:hypothetical protein